jgi:hypothetical protein
MKRLRDKLLRRKPKLAKPNRDSLNCHVSVSVRVLLPANPFRREDQSGSSRELNAMN